MRVIHHTNDVALPLVNGFLQTVVMLPYNARVLRIDTKAESHVRIYYETSPDDAGFLSAYPLIAIYTGQPFDLPYDNFEYIGTAKLHYETVQIHFYLGR